MVKVTPVTVTLGIESVPISAWLLVVVNEYAPEPAANAPLLVIPPLNSTGEFAEVLVQVPLALIVTKPVNSFAPVAEDMVRLPLVPPPTVVVPVTVKAKPAAVKAVPSPIERFPVIVNPAPVVNVEVPLRLTFPPTVIVAAVVAVADPLMAKLPLIVLTDVRAFAPEPESVRLR